MRIFNVRKSKKCKKCGAEFKLVTPRDTYCHDCKNPTCENCGKTFFYTRGSSNKYCSWKCYKPHVKIYKPPIVLNCELCGIEFQKKIGYNRRKYCSKSCRYKASRKNSLDKKRNSWEYKKWRSDVVFRDDYTCQKCGDTENLQAHHIVPWAEDAGLRYSVENGVTLCASCHNEGTGW